jgi:hypothetical protein
MAPGKVSPLSGAPLLNFDLADGDRLLPWPKGPLPNVQLLLAVDRDRGLLFYWQSRWEVGFETQPPRELVVSPLVTRLDYDYYDASAKAFTTSASPLPERDGKIPLPARLRLHFQLEKWTADTVVRVPAPTAALPAF